MNNSKLNKDREHVLSTMLGLNYKTRLAMIEALKRDDFSLEVANKIISDNNELPF